MVEGIEKVMPELGSQPASQAVDSNLRPNRKLQGIEQRHRVGGGVRAKARYDRRNFGELMRGLDRCYLTLPDAI